MLAEVFVILKGAAAMAVLMADAVLSFAFADLTHEPLPLLQLVDAPRSLLSRQGSHASNKQNLFPITGACPVNYNVTGVTLLERAAVTEGRITPELPVPSSWYRSRTSYWSWSLSGRCARVNWTQFVIDIVIAVATVLKYFIPRLYP
jgi:hypothetical protein